MRAIVTNSQRQTFLHHRQFEDTKLPIRELLGSFDYLVREVRTNLGIESNARKKMSHIWDLLLFGLPLTLQQHTLGHFFRIRTRSGLRVEESVRTHGFTLLDALTDLGRRNRQNSSDSHLLSR